MKVLIYCPTFVLEPEVASAVLNQRAGCDVMFGADNPFPNDPHRNIQHQYENMRQVVLRCGYDKVWIVEADTIPPSDALKKLREVDADVVTGLYVLRHGSLVPNVYGECKVALGEGLRWSVVRDNWGRTIVCSGGCFGCVLLDRRTLEGFDMRVGGKKQFPDTPFMGHCVKSEFKQMARLDVICGHKEPDGTILWPQKFVGIN